MKIGSFRVTADESSPGPLPSHDDVRGRYIDGESSLRITSLRGDRVEGVFFKGPADRTGVHVHGVLRTGAKLSLVGETEDSSTIAIRGRFADQKIIATVVSGEDSRTFKAARKA